jgi:DNA-binding CsgD family transcriptional regulator
MVAHKTASVSALPKRMVVPARTDIQVLLGATPRESEVIALVAAGRTPKQIARDLNIAGPTVRGHFHNIATRLGMGDRVEILLKVIEVFGCGHPACPRRGCTFPENCEVQTK